jgi:release factor glutamine methyltransferase
VKVLESNWFSNIEGRYDFIISNPPYVNKDDIDQLSPEVKNYEPHQALFAEERGLADYKKIASGAAQYLKSGGKVFLEMGQGQLGDIRTAFESEGFVYVSHWNDLAGIERAICFSF